MTAENFINQVFLGDCKRLIDAKFYYFSFPIMGFGIEFLGACLDRHQFGKRRESTKRFKKAMKMLFPSKYRSITKELCDDLRNAFAHQFRPGMSLELTHREEAVRLDRPHLEKRDGKICLVAEELYADFEIACSKVIKMIKTRQLTHPKLTRGFLTAP